VVRLVLDDVVVAFTSEDRVRDVIHNVNADGFSSLYPRYKGRPAAEVHFGPAAGDQEDRQVPAGRPWPAVLDVELSKLGEFLVAERVVEDISHEGLRALLRGQGVT
jgi:hypothetical protein